MTTTHHGEPAAQTVEEILRPLAKARVSRPLLGDEQLVGFALCGEPVPDTAILEPEMVIQIEFIPDPRFEALRRPPPMGYWQPPAAYWEGVNPSLEATLLAAAACGPVVLRTALSALEDALRERRAPTEAAARALVAAWSDEKATSGHGARGALTVTRRRKA